MYREDLDLLACPACLGGLTPTAAPGPDAPPGLDPARMIWEGELRCRLCGRSYPMLEGVACLARLDGDWLVPLKEMESRLALTMRTLEARPWEAGRAEAYRDQETRVLEAMEGMFQVALEEIDFARRPVVLDVGAGACRTTEIFRRRGARAVAVDNDLAQLRHLSFEGIDRLPSEEWRHPVSGQMFHAKDPRPLRHYLTRVFGNVARLPLATATFDVVFCRSVLHHLDRHGAALREMLRVVKPGGRIVFCAEPIRSPLEAEEDFFRHCVQREEGMHERVWPLWRFLAPIRRHVRGVVVQTWVNPPTPTLARRLPFVARWLAGRIGPGARVSGWKLPALCFCGASVNIYAARNERPIAERPIASPRPVAVRAIDHAEEELKSLVELYRVRPGEVAAGVTDLPRKRGLVARLRREIQALAAPPPCRIALASIAAHRLDRGWSDPATHRGRRGRRMARAAECTLGGARRGGQLTITLARIGGPPLVVESWLNEEAGPCRELRDEDWRLWAIDLPREVGSVVTVRLAARPLEDAAYFASAANSELKNREAEIIIGEIGIRELTLE